MGTWGADSFANDDASDWINDFCQSPRKSLLLETLTVITETELDEYLELRESNSAIAAAEVVATLKGSPSSNMSNELNTCISKLKLKVSKRMVYLALKAIQRIKTDSETKELWEESDNLSEWYQSIGNLEERLKA